MKILSSQKINMQSYSKPATIDCLFINPRDLIGASPYVKLANLAAVVRQRGISTSILDPAASGLSYRKVIEYIKDYQPKVVCIGVFPSTLPDAYKLVQLIKTNGIDTNVVLEGYQIDAAPKIIIDMGVKYAVRGDADYAFADLCEAMLNGKEPPRDTPGIIINENGQLSSTQPAYIDDLDTLPIPAYDLLPLDKYYSASTNEKYLMIFTTRGCPYTCNFCANALQLRYRYLNCDHVMAHLELLVNQYGIRWIEFMDLTFTIRRNRIVEICNRIIKNDLDFNWGCETRVDCVDEDLLVLMKQAGCQKITFGVESGSERIRYLDEKKIPNARFIEVFEMCSKHGIKTMANFIFGHPSETLEEMKETIHFSLKLRPFNVLYTRMIPLPDVSIFDTAKKNGMKADIWIDYMKGKASMPVYYPKGITKEDLDRIYKLAYIKFYFSVRTLFNYIPLFTDLKFMYKTVNVFLSLAFGSVKYK